MQQYFNDESLAIYEWKNAKGETGYYVSSPRFTEYAEDINHPKYEGDGFGSFTGLKFSRCRELAKKYMTGSGYFYNSKQNSTRRKAGRLETYYGRIYEVFLATKYHPVYHNQFHLI